jgi:tripeptide aminopeptidase
MSMFIDSLLDLALQIQHIPAPTFDEARRAEFVRMRFAAEELADVQTDPTGNVLARLPGSSPGLPLIVSAHLDTVFPLETDLTGGRSPAKISAPGLGDNALGVAALFGILWRLRELRSTLRGDIWLVANVGEEGLGDLRGMRAIVDRFGGEVRGYLILEGLAFGHVYNRGTGVRRFRVTAHTAGGHSWSDYGKPSAIHELAGLVTRFSALKLPEAPRTTLNVGKFTGGTSINTLAPEATLELDMRSEDPAALQDLIRQVEGLIASANRPGVSLETQTIGDRPAGSIRADHPLIRAALNSLQQVGVDPQLTIGSTDANMAFSRNYPAVVLGVTTGGGAHTVNEFIDIPPIDKGIRHLVDFILQVSK